MTAIDEQKLHRRIRELARRHVRWGRRLVYRRLRLEGLTVNHKRVQRIWREEGLQRPLPRRRKRSRPPGGKRELLRAEYPHHVWAIDFHFDQTMDGRTLKFLNVIDEYSRLCLAIRVGRRCRAAEVIDMIEELLKLYPLPLICGWTMARNSSPTPCRSGVPGAVAIRTKSHQVHHGRTHSWNRSTAGSGMNS